jgi:hypothetical protein
VFGDNFIIIIGESIMSFLKNKKGNYKQPDWIKNKPKDSTTTGQLLAVLLGTILIMILIS